MSVTIRVEAIKSKPLADMRKVQKQVQGALDDTGKELVKWFDKTTEHWRHEKPTFRYTSGGSQQAVWVHCYPSGNQVGIEKWVRLDEGTRPHVIKPVRARYLRFPFQGRGRSYIAITTPGHLVSHPGGTKLGPVRSFSSVDHPGHEAREWSLVLGEQEIMPFARRVDEAIAAALNE